MWYLWCLRHFGPLGDGFEINFVAAWFWDAYFFSFLMTFVDFCRHWGGNDVPMISQMEHSFHQDGDKVAPVLDKGAISRHSAVQGPSRAPKMVLQVPKKALK